jgi:hypothetical protein
VQSKSDSQQKPDLKASLIQAEKYNHHLSKINLAEQSTLTPVQSKLEGKQPIQLGRVKRNKPQSLSTGQNLTGQPKNRRNKPNLTINTNLANSTVKPHSRRNAAGYKNPSHKHPNMMPLFENAALSPVDTTRNKKDWLYSPSRRFNTHTPTHTQPPKIVKGHQNTVMGHKPDAAEKWNTVGHKQSRKDNMHYNRQTSSYHGLEEAKKSAASGSKTDRYNSPSPSKGSHPSYYDRTHPNFNPSNPWPNRFR